MSQTRRQDPRLASSGSPSPTNDRPRLLEAVRIVDEKMRSVRDAGRISGVDRIAVMAALQLAHELLGGDNSAVGPKSAELAGRIRKMTEDLDAEIKRQESLF